MEDKFYLFLDTVNESFKHHVRDINDYLIAQKCKCDIKNAKSGYVVSYILADTKKTLATFVMRKSGIKVRIYPEYIANYQDFLNSLPVKVKKEIKKASVCKRLINPDTCNPRCVRGYTFKMDNEIYQKCRYMAFMLTLNDENIDYIMSFLQNELMNRY